MMPVIYPDFPLDLTGFFGGRHLIQFRANKMQDFRNFNLKRSNLKRRDSRDGRVTNVNKKEVTANAKPKP